VIDWARVIKNLPESETRHRVQRRVRHDEQAERSIEHLKKLCSAPGTGATQAEACDYCTQRNHIHEHPPVVISSRPPPRPRWPELTTGRKTNRRRSNSTEDQARRGRVGWTRNLARELFKKHGGYECTPSRIIFRRSLTSRATPLAWGSAAGFGIVGHKKVIESGAEAVVIVDVPYFYPEQARAAVEAGLHVYMPSRWRWTCRGRCWSARPASARRKNNACCWWIINCRRSRT